ERRIENSMIKTMRELERRQLIRQYQRQEAEEEQYRLAPSTAGGSITDLKKQSQFPVDHISINSILKGSYDKIPLRGAQENKAIQACIEHIEHSQFHASAQGKGVPKEEISIKAVAG
ncbi:MAG: hypothetical protein JXA81_02185, partial [Sedimentisphaerales bacterium]|nr:hypothetical protein [Sedimentisphaerales bacterium]